MKDPSRRDLLRYSSVGLEFILTFGLWLGVGFWLDHWLGTLPGFLLIGGVVGFVIGVYRMARQGREMQKAAERKPEEDKDAQGSEGV